MDKEKKIMIYINSKQKLSYIKRTINQHNNYLLLIVIISICIIQLYCGKSSDGSGSFDSSPTVTVSPVSGDKTAIFCITLECDKSGYDIYYTTDGTEPAAVSKKYVKPIPVTLNGSSVDIKAAAFKNGVVESDIAEGSWSLSYGFGISSSVTICAASAIIEGIDVSKWQGAIDWVKVAATGKRFVFIRATDGTSKDEKFFVNWVGAKDAGILRAPYHTFEPAADARVQADTFLGCFTLEAGDLPPLVAVEIYNSSISAESYASALCIFINRLISVTGKMPIIYNGVSFWNTSLNGCTAFVNCPHFIARWGTGCPSVSTTWPSWTFWQYTDSGTVDGITGNVDLNQFNGTEQQIEELLL